VLQRLVDDRLQLGPDLGGLGLDPFSQRNQFCRQGFLIGR
jgi:hypothetical protein